MHSAFSLSMPQMCAESPFVVAARTCETRPTYCVWKRTRARPAFPRVRLVFAHIYYYTLSKDLSPRFWSAGPNYLVNLVRPQIIWTGIFACRLILRSRNVLAIYELPSSNEDQMEFRYKHWCVRAERDRTRAPPCRRYSGGTSYCAGGPVMARRNLSPMRPDHKPQPGPL